MMFPRKREVPPPLVRELAADVIPVAVTCRALNLARPPYSRWRTAPHVDVKITGPTLTIMYDGEVIASHAVSGRRDSFVTDPDHVPAQHLKTSDLWSRAYFVRQAHKIGPHTVTAISEFLHRQRIDAQCYRSCQNILGLARGDNKQFFERACGQLVSETSRRTISYTAAKQPASGPEDPGRRPARHVRSDDAAGDCNA